MTSKAVFVTLLTKKSYLAGSLVLEHTLRSVGSKYPLIVMITPGVHQDIRDLLHKRGVQTHDVEPLLPPANAKSFTSHDARFQDTWTKLRVFELTDYDRVVLLDSDMIALRNMDELMELDLPADWIAAAHACACNPMKFKHYPDDWIPENCAHTAVTNPTALPPQVSPGSPRPYGLLNSGLVVLNPSTKLAEAIKDYLWTSPLVSTFSFPDQDLLAAFFIGKWKPLPWYYNALKTLRVIHKPLWKDEEVRCLHYILPEKPWDSRAGKNDNYQELHRWWWDRYDKLQGEFTDETAWNLVASGMNQK